ncbi:putative dihydrouridine synthase (Dus) [Leishmania mexicana MHOM/GT/2001/U1103]|uniref:tRNA-dihydrouridine(16/17) synthase [NAD(P)(+)] n=1 Tax=Leishmania mexicana (strain MHOM/GT/2001/U1103) TaxID=929439 RepID=E9B1Z2_LEIMU|nr:putative dihydrouridine synthase (Dus) [Leishmania mexicana MHOM/GT/2001/U1103]CBZ29249.1 putative dihydrouridine synthase (Dus) [Leishmania mexicana MHOM/GT/2001/U1103]
MAYNPKKLEAYRQLIAEGKPFRSITCPYCNGRRDATVKHVHPSTKPSSAWGFWNDVLVRKYAAVQSPAARANMEATVTGSSAVRGAPLRVAEEVTDNEAAAEALHLNATSGPRMFIVGPMVDQSELPFRMLCRQYGATVAYTPMLHAKSFADGAAYRSHFLSVCLPDEVKAAMEAALASPSVAAGEHGGGGSMRAGVGADSEDAVADTVLVDRPCIVQFCGNDADTVLRAARFAVLGEQAAATEQTGDNGGASAAPVYPVHVRVNGLSSSEKAPAHLLYQCDAVDLNLGCPQGIARRGHYGSFLMEDWELIHTIVHTLHVELEVPVTVKIRVFDHPGHVEAAGDNRECATDCSSAGCEENGAACATADTSREPLKAVFDEALTILYARMIRDAGAQMLCIHGRTREMKGQQTGLANMALIRRVRDALGGTIPVISNGNVRTYDDVIAHLQETRCEGHMCAEPLLWDPKLFSNPSQPVMPGRTHGADKATRLSALHTALVYMQWVRYYPVDIGFVKAHLFKMCFHSYELHTSFREELGQLKTSAAKIKAEKGNSIEVMDMMRLGAAPGADDSSAPSGAVHEEGDDEESAAVATASAAASVPASAFKQCVDAIEAHLLALMEAERRCSVDGEQPKSAQAEKAKAKQEIVDVWEEGGDLGIDF